MMPIRALLVDDERNARDSVCALLRDEPHWQVIGECQDAAALPQAISAVAPDVVFLDIAVLGGDGVALGHLLQQLEPRPLFVFTTALERYAVLAFECQAVDYLLKPFDDVRFQLALRRVEQALASGLKPAAPAVEAAPPAARYLQRLVIRSIGRVQIVDVAQIAWLRASGNYIEVHTGDEVFLHRERLHVLDGQLDPAEFVRIHRSLIVQRAAVKELRPLAGGDYSVLLHGGEVLRLSRTYRAALDVLSRDR